ncbi:MAG TPA: divalent-cation tolerance protein CutA [bacterium]|jgi:periplasmic divalent cation tolerance protein|nr:divalent-cation tolerance protein CutA [bacterium]HOC23732.1 divalent-cation tolerance protein CutA [bacterium]HOH07215.1 divalent-cation tolerance protein CutA [bacterium]HOY44123.1 divalent-cation tolerance protein CutA [bacterium]HPG82201.1 divalent-cation tolerance protein CutA [bacterium]
MESFLLVTTTCASREEAEVLAEKLLKVRLIACANIFSGVHSIFHWRGKIERAEEVVLQVKCRKRYFRDLVEWIQTHHSYELPEILALPIVDGSREYLDWMMEETRFTEFDN